MRSCPYRRLGDALYRRNEVNPIPKVRIGHAEYQLREVKIRCPLLPHGYHPNSKCDVIEVNIRSSRMPFRNALRSVNGWQREESRHFRSQSPEEPRYVDTYRRFLINDCHDYYTRSLRGLSFPAPCVHAVRGLDMDRSRVCSIGSGRGRSVRQLDSTC